MPTANRMPTAKCLAASARLRLRGRQDHLHGRVLGVGAHHRLAACSDHGVRDAADPVLVRLVRELGVFDHAGRDGRVFGGYLEGQNNGARAVRACGGDEHLEPEGMP